MASFFDGLGSALLGGGLSFLGAREQQKAIQSAAQQAQQLTPDRLLRRDRRRRRGAARHGRVRERR